MNPISVYDLGKRYNGIIEKSADCGPQLMIRDLVFDQRLRIDTAIPTEYTDLKNLILRIEDSTFQAPVDIHEPFLPCERQCDHIVLNLVRCNFEENFECSKTFSCRIEDCVFHGHAEFNEIENLDISKTEFFSSFEFSLDRKYLFVKLTTTGVTFHDKVRVFLSGDGDLYVSDVYYDPKALTFLDTAFLGPLDFRIELEDEELAIATNRCNAELLHWTAPHVRQLVYP